MRALLALLVVVAGCKQDAPPPSPAPTSAESGPVAKPAPSASPVATSSTPAAATTPSTPAMTLAPGRKLGFKDFWEIAGVSRTDTPATVKAKWGAPKSVATEDGTTLRYESVSVTFGGPYGSVMLDFTAYGEDERAFVAAHPSAPLALLGMSCEEAAKHLAFTDKIEAYTTCKHYDKNGYLVDVTFMCTETVSSLVVMWTPLPPDVEPVADHCG